MLRFMAVPKRLHERMMPHLQLSPQRTRGWIFGALVVLIWALGALLRARFINALGTDDFWNGQPLLTSADGYHYAAGVMNALTGDWDGLRVPDPAWHGLVGISALLVELFGLSPEAVYTWLPVVVGPLIAIPVALLGRAVGSSLGGLVAALFIVMAPAYLERTALGYFDTDMFALSIPMLAAWLAVRMFRGRAPLAAGVEPSPGDIRRDGLALSLVLSVYVYFYDQAAALTQSMTLVIALGLLLACSARRLAAPPIQTAIADAAPHIALLLALAILPLHWAWCAAAILVVHLAVVRMAISVRVLATAAALVMATSLVGGTGVAQIFEKVGRFGATERPSEAPPGERPAPAKEVSSTDPSGIGDARWAARDTTGTVAEARVLSFGRMTQKLAGHWVVACVGLVGFVLLIVWRPSLFVLLPLTALGVFAFVGGHRFLIYLVPAVSLGIGYVVARIARSLPVRTQLAAGACLGVCAALPAAFALRPLDVQVTFTSSEAEVLTRLDALTSADDTTISWWDSGYPIKYFAKTRTITDGARRGEDASLAAEILMTESPHRAAALARLAADASHHDPVAGPARLLFGEARSRGLGPAKFFAEVDAGRGPPLPRSGHVDIFLSPRLLPILQVIDAMRPASSSLARRAPYMRLHVGVRSEGPMLFLEGGGEVDANAVRLRQPNGRGAVRETILREVHVVSGAGATFQKGTRLGDADAPIAGVLLRDLAVFVELDARLLQTQWARLYLFEDADPRFFQPLVMTPTTKIYRVR